MSKLSAVLSKKVPIPGLEYSSQQFSCGLELDLPGEQTQDSIRQKIRSLYALLHSAIDEEIRDAVANPPEFMRSLQNSTRSSAASPETRRWGNRAYGDNRRSRWSKPGSGSRYGGGGSQPAGRATQAQVKAVYAISKSNGMERRELTDLLEDRFNVSQPEELSVKQASKLIETLKEDGGQE